MTYTLYDLQLTQLDSTLSRTALSHWSLAKSFCLSYGNELYKQNWPENRVPLYCILGKKDQLFSSFLENPIVSEEKGGGHISKSYSLSNGT